MHTYAMYYVFSITVRLHDIFITLNKVFCIGTLDASYDVLKTAPDCSIKCRRTLELYNFIDIKNLHLLLFYI